MDNVTLWLVIAAVLFGIAALIEVTATAVARAGFLIPAGLLALAIAFIVERN
jgi:hypothetical protein